MSKPGADDDANAHKAIVVGIVDGSQQRIKDFKHMLTKFDNQLAGLGGEIAKEISVKEAALRDRNNLAQVNDDLYQQNGKDKAVDLGRFKSLMEDYAKILEDKRRIDFEVEELNILNQKKDETQRGDLKKLMDENNGNIQRLEDKVKILTAEIGHLKGVERMFILELGNITEKHRVVQQLTDEVGARKVEIEILQRSQVKAKEEIATLLQKDAAYLSRMEVLSDGNDLLEDANRKVTSEAARSDDLQRKVQNTLRDFLMDTEHLTFKDEANHKSMMALTISLKERIQALEDDKAASDLVIQSLRYSQTTMIKENEVLKAQICLLNGEHLGSLADIQALQDSKPAAIEKNEAVKADVSAPKSTHQASLSELLNLKGSQQAMVEDNRILEAHILAQQHRPAMISHQTSHVESHDLNAEIQVLKDRIYELEDDRKLIEPLTKLGVSVRMAYLLYGRNQALLDNTVGEVAYRKNIIADAALFQAGFLSEEGAGELFLECYGYPILMSLSYDEMPKYRMMLDLFTQFDNVKGCVAEFSQLTLSSEWAERKQVIASLQAVWNEARASDSMQFEGCWNVDSMLKKLEDLNQKLHVNLISLLNEDVKDLLDM
ncbi:uncharacterized protein RSE6_10609 [Rhynchosporium secalis]|uniref:Uncharacterized protein n=1 Tax=Rhynchosporium secalis TaxID=38038 RepID=A0A1E1MLV4_RHYSE|nr:uncharacterized protein RSE6_10609 [Rhynchosporium secalis]